MKTLSIFRLIPGLLATAALVAACGGAKPATPAAPVQTPAQPSAPVTQPATPAEPLKVTVQVKDFSFEPKEITAVKGQKIIVTVKNGGEKKHDLVLQGPYEGTKSQTIEAGQETTFEFVADKVGTFEFICDLKGHKDRGMVGSLVVQDK